MMTHFQLAVLLQARIAGGALLRVPLATPADLDGFESERNQCYRNVDRWCRLHLDHSPRRGWIVTSGVILDRHSVVDRGTVGLLDITPMDDRRMSEFLPHEGSREEFDALPSRVIVSPL